MHVRDLFAGVELPDFILGSYTVQNVPAEGVLSLLRMTPVV
jgi:hypothetical protein